MTKRTPSNEQTTRSNKDHHRRPIIFHPNKRKLIKRNPDPETITKIEVQKQEPTTFKIDKEHTTIKTKDQSLLEELPSVGDSP